MNKIIATVLGLISVIFFSSQIYAYDPTTLPNNIYGIGVINHSDLEDVSNLVNTNGGDWGYVTIVITENDINREKWQKFMDDCRKYHLIPIVRVATNFDGKNWEIPKVEKIDSWVNFFNSLNWVTENRYIVIGNEPNHSKEWGGKINPAEYAIYLKKFSERLHNSSHDYFVLNAGFDQDAPNGRETMDEKKYIEQMIKNTPDVFNFIDGWSSHSYPNPAFSGNKTAVGRRSVRGYEWELEIINKQNLPLRGKDLPVFITETGWIRNSKNETSIANNLKYVYEEVWSKNKNVVAVTPFILNYQDKPFLDFSWKKSPTEFYPIYQTIQNIQKIKGEPLQKISGEVLFSFLNPLILRNHETRGFTVVKNTGQAIWTQAESNVINELDNEIKVSNTKFAPIEPFSVGLVVYTLKTSDIDRKYDVRLGFYVRGQKIGDVFNGKIISF